VLRFDRDPISEHSTFIPRTGFIHSAGTGIFSAWRARVMVVG